MNYNDYSYEVARGYKVGEQPKPKKNYLTTGLHNIHISENDWYENLGAYRNRNIRYVVVKMKYCVKVYLVARHPETDSYVHFGVVVPQNIDGYHNVIANIKNYDFIKKQWWFQDVRTALKNYTAAK